MSPDVYEVFELLEFQNILEAYPTQRRRSSRFEAEIASRGARRAAEA